MEFFYGRIFQQDVFAEDFSFAGISLYGNIFAVFKGQSIFSVVKRREKLASDEAIAGKFDIINGEGIEYWIIVKVKFILCY
jgi:hypothetical protein